RAERDEPRVLHRAALLRNRDVIELLVRIRDAEVRLEPLDDLPCRLGSIGGLGRSALGHDDANGDSILPGPTCIDDLEWPDREGNEVARERLRRRERDSLPSVRRRALARLRRVGERQLVLRNLERELPRRLEARLVETRKRAPRIRRLELRVDVPVATLFLA